MSSNRWGTITTQGQPIVGQLRFDVTTDTVQMFKSGGWVAVDSTDERFEELRDIECVECGIIQAYIFERDCYIEDECTECGGLISNQELTDEE